MPENFRPGPMTAMEIERFSAISDTIQDKELIDTIFELAEREGQLLTMEPCISDRELREITCYRIATLCAAIGRIQSLSELINSLKDQKIQNVKSDDASGDQNNDNE